MSGTIRAFLSINIENHDLLAGLKRLQDQLDKDAAKLKLVEENNIHFTLRFFGDVSYSHVEKIENCLDSVHFDEFTTDVYGVGAFPTNRKPRVIWVGLRENEKLMVELKSQIDECLKTIGHKRERRAYTPHATIARVRRVYDRDRLGMNLDSLSETEIGMMTVNEFTLMKSTLTPSGPIYDVIWRKRAE